MFFWLMIFPPEGGGLKPQSIQTDPSIVAMINCRYIIDKKAGNFFSFTLQGEPWTLYSVESSSDLVTWEMWNAEAYIPFYSGNRATVQIQVDNPTEVGIPTALKYFRVVKIGDYYQYP